MDQQQRDEIHEMLVNRREELKAIIQSNEALLKEQLSPADGDQQIDFSHPADIVQSESDFEKEISLIKRERAELAMVVSALARMTNGGFGDCEDCGTSIPIERLKAIPYTKYCIECKEAKDSEAKLLLNTNSPVTDPHHTVNIGL